MTNRIYDKITGNEPFGIFTTPHDVLVEFYHAFNSGDLNIMSNNWLQTPDASMSNPLGGLKRGWSEIKQVYENIFNGPAQVYVEYYDFSIFGDKTFFHATGRERGHFTLHNKSINLRIRTSRTYVMHNGRFRQLHHHGSIEEPELLNAYQTGVRTGKLA